MKKLQMANHKVHAEPIVQPKKAKVQLQHVQMIQQYMEFGGGDHYKPIILSHSICLQLIQHVNWEGTYHDHELAFTLYISTCEEYSSSEF